MPPAKKQKVEDEATPENVEMTPADTAEASVPEAPKELEQDAPATKVAKITDKICFLTADTTMNVMPSTEGNLLMALTEGGIRHLLAGARASVGVKAGRYMFETKVIEHVVREDRGGRTIMPRHVLRIGVSTAASSLILGDSADSVCFDFDGSFMHNKKRTPIGTHLSHEGVFAIVLNLDAGSANANTISLFKDGVRASQPQTLPAHLHGKTLFPTVTFRHLTVQANFGPSPIAKLPFACNMFQHAVLKEADVQKTTDTGKYEAIFPVCLPGEGSFDWLDTFLAKNPQYTEISDRAILEWCDKSGIERFGIKASNDKPMTNFGVADLDDMSLRRMLLQVAPLQNRSYVVMEVKSNLMKEERAQALTRFDTERFARMAIVVMGEPTKQFKTHIQQLMLSQKQAASDLAFTAKKAEEARKKMLEKRLKELEKARKQQERERKRKLAEILKAKAEAQAKAAGTEVPVEDEIKEDEEPEEEDKPEDDDMDVDEAPPKVTLTAEEKQLAFRVSEVPDLVPFVLSTSFTSFSLPSKDEGFSEIQYPWSKESACESYLKEWILKKKVVTPVEGLIPGDYFNNQWRKWQQQLKLWQEKHKAYKFMLNQKVQAKLAKAAKKALNERVAALKAETAKKMAAFKKAAQAEKGEAAEGEQAATEEKKEEDAPMPAAEPEEPEEEEEEAEEDTAKATADFENLDVFGTENILDIGGGLPLFKEFGFEDWCLLGLSFELHLMAHSFKKDVNDSDRIGIPSDHIGFYYGKYYKKPMSPMSFGLESMDAVVGLVKDSVYITKSKVLASAMGEEMESFQVFVQMTEEARRERSLLIDAGEASAALKFGAPAPFSFAGEKGAPQLKGLGKGVAMQAPEAFVKGAKGPELFMQGVKGAKGPEALFFKGAKGEALMVGAKGPVMMTKGPEPFAKGAKGQGPAEVFGNFMSKGPAEGFGKGATEMFGKGTKGPAKGPAGPAKGQMVAPPQVVAPRPAVTTGKGAFTPFTQPQQHAQQAFKGSWKGAGK